MLKNELDKKKQAKRVNLANYKRIIEGKYKELHKIYEDINR
jgi:hypothetical protein